MNTYTRITAVIMTDGTIRLDYDTYTTTSQFLCSSSAPISRQEYARLHKQLTEEDGLTATITICELTTVMMMIVYENK